MESGNFTFEKVPFNLDELCKKVYKAYEHNALQKNLNFTYSPLPNSINNLIGDKLRLQQVLTNLVSNAIKFTEQGKVDFSYRIKFETAKQVTIEFKIADTGIGITNEYQKKIFDTFSQVDDTATRQYGGTGLGLAISKRLVDLQFGKLYMESRLNEGSTFYVELTFDKQHEVQQQFQPIIVNEGPTEIKEPLKLSGMKILVAEDNSINAMVLTRFLTNWGVVYDVAKNGQIAIEYLKEKEYDLILMDLQMPVLGGREATKIIRNSFDNQSNIPVIALTADAFVDFKTTLLEEGFNAYISKPFNPNELFDTILKYYDNQK
jgi:CheY-like chemotaxis protein